MSGPRDGDGSAGPAIPGRVRVTRSRRLRGALRMRGQAVLSANPAQLVSVSNGCPVPVDDWAAQTSMVPGTISRPRDARPGAPAVSLATVVLGALSPRSRRCRSEVAFVSVPGRVRQGGSLMS